MTLNEVTAELVLDTWAIEELAFNNILEKWRKRQVEVRFGAPPKSSGVFLSNKFIITLTGRFEAIESCIRLIVDKSDSFGRKYLKLLISIEHIR